MEDLYLDDRGQRRLLEYFDQIGDVLGLDERRASYAVYAMGLLGDGERKSMEPICARADPDARRVSAQHQRVQHFLTDSSWSDREVRRHAAQYGIAELTRRQSITHWIVDDTGFLKQGSHSVGVKRQYTGSAGKITNCQVGVSLSVATATDHLPIDFELYLPRDWTDDADRRREGRIPDHVTFKTKLELALDMVDRASADGVPRGMFLVDTAYGNSSHFRKELRKRGFSYGVAVNATTKVWQLDRLERRTGGRTLSVADYANKIVERGGFRRTTWREGTNRAMASRFAARRVLPIADEGYPRAEREAVWLLMEWERSRAAPNKFHFITAPNDATKKWLVRQVKQRWRTERAYQDLKGELGLDHFEGRRYRGWHHHVSVVLSCYAFLVAERARRFPPTGHRARRARSHRLAA